MPKYITVKVTQEHIDQGTPERATSCPIALALRETTNEACCYIDDFGWGAGDRLGGDITRRARHFMHRFDHKPGVKPTTFRLPVDSL